VHGTHYIKKTDDIAVYKDLYEKVIKALRDDEIDMTEVEEFDYMNDYLLKKFKSWSV